MRAKFTVEVLEAFRYSLEQRGVDRCNACQEVVLINDRPTYLPIGIPTEGDFQECFSTECPLCGLIDLFLIKAYYGGDDPLFELEE